MQLLCNLIALCHSRKQFGRRVLRVACHKAQPEIAGHGVETAQKIGKIHVNAEILTIGVDVLAEQRNLLVTRRDQLTQFFLDLLRSAAALSAAHIRHNAVGAEIVAAIHDGQPRLCALGTQHRQTFGDIVLAADVEHALFLGQHAVQQRRKSPERMRAEQEIYLRIAFLNLLDVFLLLGHAAAHCNNNARALLFQMAECADVAERTILGMLTHSTGVEQDKICLVGRIGHFVAHFGQHAADTLGIRLVLLAAERMRIGFWALVPQ